MSKARLQRGDNSRGALEYSLRSWSFSLALGSAMVRFICWMVQYSESKTRIMTISPEAKEAASRMAAHFNEDADWVPDYWLNEIQLAINSATALLQEEIIILKKIEAYANEKLSNSNHHSVFESIDDAALTLIEQRTEIARLRGEVEKAYREGWDIANWSNLGIGQDYEISRARRVAEGTII